MNNDDFPSIEKMMELGFGMGVAQQMVSSMNHALRNTHIPGPHSPAAAAPSVTYYAVLGEKAAGPFALSELQQLIGQARLDRQTYVWSPGMIAWDRAGNVPEVLRLLELAPPRMPSPPPYPR